MPRLVKNDGSFLASGAGEVGSLWAAMALIAATPLSPNGMVAKGPPSVSCARSDGSAGGAAASKLSAQVFSVVFWLIPKERGLLVVHRRAVIVGNSVDDGEARCGRRHGAVNKVAQVIKAEPCAQCAGVLRDFGGREDAQMHRFHAPFGPVQFTKVFGETFGQPVKRIGGVIDIKVRTGCVFDHADRVHR